VSVLVMFSAKYYCSFYHTLLWQLLWSIACKTCTPMESVFLLPFIAH